MTHPADELAGLIASGHPDPDREALLRAHLVGDREGRVGDRHHAIVRALAVGEDVTVEPLPDLEATLELLSGTLAVADTETTGLFPARGDRITSVGIVEGTVDGAGFRGTATPYHRKVNPGRASSAAARAVHGMEDADLALEPAFGAVAFEVARLLEGRTVVAHNAPFDVEFLDAEFARTRVAGMAELASAIVDTRVISKMLWPGEKGSLDALASRLGVDRTARDVAHGALLDADILARCLPGLAEAIRRKLGATPAPSGA